VCDAHRGFPARFEDLAIEQFVPQLAVKTFDRGILPGEVVIGPNMLGHAMLHEELAEPMETHDHTVAAYLPIIQSSMKNSS